MRKIGLIILAVIVAMFFAGLAYAVDEVAPAKKMDSGAGNIWKKPEVNAERTFEIVPLGIDKRGGDIPGKGIHLGWEKGEHKGWDKVGTSEKIEGLNTALDKLEGAIEEYVSQLKDWLNARPSFGINQEGGISGYRQEIKSWLDKQPEGPDDIIKEITASF